MNQQKQNKVKKGFDNFIRYSSLGFEMMVIIALGTFGGYKIDQWLKNEFKAFTLGLMIISVFVAIIYGTRNLLKK
jgi:hypothetical protein